MTKEEIYLEIKSDKTINSLFALAMRRQDLWKLIKERKWDKDILVVCFDHPILRTTSFRSTASRWTIKQKIRYYYKFHYKKKLEMLKDIHFYGGDLFPRHKDLQLPPRTGRKVKKLAELKKLLINIQPLTIKNAIRHLIAVDEARFTTFQNFKISTWENFYSKSYSELSKLTRSVLLQNIIDLGIKEEDCSEALRKVLADKWLKIPEYCHIVWDRPLEIKWFPYLSPDQAIICLKPFNLKSRNEFTDWARFSSPLIPYKAPEMYQMKIGQLIGTNRISNVAKNKKLLQFHRGSRFSIKGRSKIVGRMVCLL